MVEDQVTPTLLPPGEAVRPFAAILPRLPRRAAVVARAIPATGETPAELLVKVARPQVLPVAHAPAVEPPTTVARDLVAVEEIMGKMTMSPAFLEFSSGEVIRSILPEATQKPEVVAVGTLVAGVAGKTLAVVVVLAISAA